MIGLDIFLSNAVSINIFVKSNLYLLVTGYFIALLGSYIAQDVYVMQFLRLPEKNILWAIVSGVILGVSIWASNFLGVMACNIPNISYDIDTLLLSLLLAIIGTILGFYFITNEKKISLKLMLSAVPVSLIVAASYYIGIDSIKNIKSIKLILPMFFTSLILFYLATLSIYFVSLKNITCIIKEKMSFKLIAALFEGSVIYFMHFFVMLSASYIFVHINEVLTHDDRYFIALIILLIFFLIILVPLAATTYEQVANMVLKNKNQELSAIQDKLHEQNLQLEAQRSQLQEAQNIAHLGSWSRNIQTGEITYSKEVRSLLELNDETLIHYAQIRDKMYPQDRDFYEKTVKNAIEKKEPYEADIRFHVTSGIRWLHLLGKPIYENDKTPVLITSVVMDITQRKLAELRKNMEHNVLQALVQSDELTDVVQSIIKTIAETFDWELGSFWTLDTQNQFFRREAIWVKNKTLLESYMHFIPDNTASTSSHFLISKVYKTHEMHWLNVSNMEGTNYSAFFKKNGINSVFCFPVFNNDQLNFVMVFHDKKKNPLNEDDLQSIDSISNQLGLFIQKKQAQENEKKMNLQLISTARHAGMADVATSVLHNIGNILNSVNVSVNLLQNKLQKSKLLNGFIEVNNQLKSHANDLETYLTENNQAEKIASYLSLIEKAIKEERIDINNEMTGLLKNIQHIKDVLMMQQAFGNVLGLVESLSIAEQLNATIKIIGFDSSYLIERQYETDQPVFLDKVKLLQILINLIRNAKDSLMGADKKEKKLILKTVLTENFIQISVTDNGVGIKKDNIDKIFSFGFTTKKQGHGFGLHISALLAKEMGGSLHVRSEGEGKGATFILELPCSHKENENA